MKLCGETAEQKIKDHFGTYALEKYNYKDSNPVYSIVPDETNKTGYILRSSSKWIVVIYNQFLAFILKLILVKQSN